MLNEDDDVLTYFPLNGKALQKMQNTYSSCHYLIKANTLRNLLVFSHSHFLSVEGWMGKKPSLEGGREWGMKQPGVEDEKLVWGKNYHSGRSTNEYQEVPGCLLHR